MEKMHDLTTKESQEINGGADYLDYSGGNGLIYFGVACYNAGVTVYNWITGEEAGVRNV